MRSSAKNLLQVNASPKSMRQTSGSLAPAIGMMRGEVETAGEKVGVRGTNSGQHATIFESPYKH